MCNMKYISQKHNIMLLAFHFDFYSNFFILLARTNVELVSIHIFTSVLE